MRILLTSTGYPPDGLWGTETYTREVARGLAARGHEVLVLHPLRGGPRAGLTGSAPVDEVRRGRVRVVRVIETGPRGRQLRTSYENPALERAFEQVLAGFRPDCVHFLHLLWSLSVRLPGLARAAGVPTVLTATDLGLVCHRGQMHDWLLEACGGAPPDAATCARCIREPAPFDGSAAEVALKRLAVRALSAVGGLGRVVTARDVEQRAAAVASALTRVQHVLAPTRAVAGVLRAAGLCNPEVLPYALDDTPLRAARAAPPGPVQVRFLGQLAPHKGPATLVRAAELLARRLGPDEVGFHLHGAASPGRHRGYARALEARARAAGVAVEPPFGPDALAGVLADTAAIAIPSEWIENAPFTALQARAAGVPVVASDVPGLREVIVEGLHGWLVPPGDAAALAERIEWLVRAGPRRMPEPGLSMSLAVHLSRLEGLYAELARSHAAGAVGAGAV